MVIVQIDSTFDKHDQVTLGKKRFLPALALSLAVSLTGFQTAAWADDEPTPIKKISVNSDKQIVVEFAMGDKATLKAPKLEDFPGPTHRLVIDFTDAVIEKGKTQPASQTLKELSKAYPDIKGIRYAALKNADEPTARIVLDLPESFPDNPQVVNVGADSVTISLVGTAKVAASNDVPAATSGTNAPAIASTQASEIGDGGRIQPNSSLLTPAAPIAPQAAKSPLSTYAAPAQTESSMKTGTDSASTTASKLELPGKSVEDTPAEASKPSIASAQADSTSPFPTPAAKETQTSPKENTTSESTPAEGASAKQAAVRHYNDAVKLHLAGKLTAAIAEYQAAIKDYPNLSEAHSNLGLIYNQQHNYPQALAELRKALAINPKDAITYNGVGAALRAQKDLTGAIKNWQTAISLDPKLATAHYNLGTAYEIQKDFDKALVCYKQAVKNDYRLGEAHYRMGLILQKKNNPEEAIAAFNKALEASAKADYSEDVRQRIAVIEKKEKSTGSAALSNSRE